MTLVTTTVVATATIDVQEWLPGTVRVGVLVDGDAYEEYVACRVGAVWRWRGTDAVRVVNVVPRALLPEIEAAVTAHTGLPQDADGFRPWLRDAGDGTYTLECGTSTPIGDAAMMRAVAAVIRTRSNYHQGDGQCAVMCFQETSGRGRVLLWCPAGGRDPSTLTLLEADALADQIETLLGTVELPKDPPCAP